MRVYGSKQDGSEDQLDNSAKVLKKFGKYC